MSPTEPVARLAGVADENIDLGWTKVSRINRDQLAAGSPIKPFLLGRKTLPCEFDAGPREGAFGEVAHAVRASGGEHIVVGLWLLKHEPHPPDEIARVTPVAAGFEIAEIKLLPAAEFDCRGRAGDLARDERFAAGRALVVE